MPEVTVNGINLYFETYGVGEPVIFIHGFAQDHIVFATFPQYYQDKFKVILFDNRGSGQSDCPDIPYTVEMMADDVIKLCRSLNLGPCHIVGHSLGGMIAQQIALQKPEQVRSLVLCNTNSKIDIRYALTAKARLEYLHRHCSQRSLIEGSLGWSFSNEFLSRPNMVEKLIQMRLANPHPITPLGYKHQLNALFRFNSSAWAHEIKVPCLVVSSDQDIITPPASVDHFVNLIKHAEHQCISGTGHVPFIEKPEIFHRIVSDWLYRYGYV